MEDLFHLGVKALIKNKQGEFLLLKNNPNKPPRFSNTKHWDLPGGRIKDGANLEETLKREVEEEIGIKDIKIVKFLDASISNLKINLTKKPLRLVLFTYLCSIKDPLSVKLTDDEHTEFKWFNSKEAAKLLKIKFSDSLTRQVAKL